MIGETPTALSLAPLAVYFVVLAMAHRGRSPVVVLGSLDFRLLALGLGSLVAFGPIGQVLTAPYTGWPGLADRLGLLGLIWLIVGLAAPGAARRVLVFGATPHVLEAALEDVLRIGAIPSFARTSRGFEDRTSGRCVDLPRRARSGCLELTCAGPDAERFAAELARELRPRLRHEVATRSPLRAWAWLAAGLMIGLLPFVRPLLAPSHDGSMLRALLRSLGAL